MKSIQQTGRSFNAPLTPLVSDSTALCGNHTALAVPFQVSSQTTLMGHRSHTVTTRESALAFALYEQALQIDIEPDFALNKGVWTIGFICNDAERDQALTSVCALTVASEVTA